MSIAITVSDQQARDLTDLDLHSLRAAWRDRFGAPHPPFRSSELLRRLLAWRIQAEALGGLDRQTRKIVQGVSKPRTPGPVLTPGVRLSREWRGRICDVEVTAGGFLFDGRGFDSLSEIAREITGVRWNGPRFFGLRKGSTA